MPDSELINPGGLFRGAFEAAGIGLATADVSGALLSTNPSLQRMLGYTAEELSRMRLADFTHPNDVSLDAQQFGRL